MARAQSSFAISAAFCSIATMVRPESSASMVASGCPLLGANATTVGGLSDVWTLMSTPPSRFGTQPYARIIKDSGIFAPDDWRGSRTNDVAKGLERIDTIAKYLEHSEKWHCQKRTGN